MKESPTHPIRSLRTVAALARWMVRLSLLMLAVLLSAWAWLYAWVVPRADTYRPWLERRATEVLGVQVRIGAIESWRAGWLPTLALQDVRLSDGSAQGQFRLGRVVLALTPQSLWGGNLAQIIIEAPELFIHRRADGQWQLGPWHWQAVGRAPSGAANSSAVDWFLSQPEVVLRRGVVHWSEEAQASEASPGPRTFTDIGILMRNGLWRHELRVQVQPPAAVGDALTVVGQFREPLLGTDLRRWSGQWYAQWQRADLGALRQMLPADLLPPSLPQWTGQGGLRVWGDVTRGRWRGVTADVALQDLQVQWPQRPALQWSRFQGRVEGRWDTDDVLQVRLQDLLVQSPDMAQPQPHTLQLRYAMTPGRDQGTLTLAQLDLGRWSRWAQALPLPEAVAQSLEEHPVQGTVQDVSWQWTGAWNAPRSYQLQASVHGVSVGGAEPDPEPERWGVAGLQARITATQQGGQAQVDLAKGHLVLPGVFEEPVVPVEQLHTEVRWQRDGEHLSVELPRLRFANADAAGSARLRWHTGDPKAKPAQERFPGVLDLEGQLDRANGARVHRYLPLEIPAEARHYVRDAIAAGVADHTTFKVQGDLTDLPFERPGTGTFRIAAQLRDVVYAYVPRSLQTPGEKPWPRLTHLAGLLVFEGAGMQVRDAHARMEGIEGVVLQDIQARIPDLESTRVDVRAQAQGPLPSLLQYVRQSPVDALTDSALSRAESAGPARLALQLDLPIAALEQSKVVGEVSLEGNRLRLLPDMPWLTAARGRVQFSEQGFALQNVQAQALGGALQAEGGMQVLEGQPAKLDVVVRGEVSDQGLRESEGLALLAQLGTQLRGRTRYELQLQSRDGQPHWTVRTDLQGMEVLLPAPLNKGRTEAWPLRYVQWTSGEGQAAREQVEVEVPGRLAARLAWSAQEDAPWELERGQVQLGADLPPPVLPDQGLEVSLQWPLLDVDAWMAWMPSPAGAAAPDVREATVSGESMTTAQASAAPQAQAWWRYAPRRFQLQVDALQVQGRRWHDVVVQGTRQEQRWAAQVRTRELEGQFRYDPDQGEAGSLHARLRRLEIPKDPAPDTTVASGSPATASGNGHDLPALDIEVEHFVVHGRSLGKLELQARNRALDARQRVWHLQHLELRMPEALLTAQGRWSQPPQPASGGGQTSLDFTLELADAGKLLSRWDYADVLRHGAGMLQGQLQWEGSPVQFNASSLSGQLHVQVGQGQFLKADPGMAKLLSVLSLQSLPRRLQLDFRDIFSEGFAFDRIQGQVEIGQGVARTSSLEMRGLNAAVLMEGEADIVRETQQLKVMVVPEINAMTASLLAATINPVVGVGSLLAQWALRGPLMEAATQVFHIHGTWDEPTVEKVTASAAREAARP